MAVLRLDLDNILCFSHFSVDFSYPKKLVNSKLSGEFLSNYPNIRYRKANIVIGSNASGKTSLGRALWQIFLFLKEKEAQRISYLVNRKEEPFFILMDCIFNNGVFFRAEIKKESPNEEMLVRLQQLNANANDSYETLVSRLDNTKPFESHLTALSEFEFGGWHFCFPSIEDGFDQISCKYEEAEKADFCEVFQSVLSTMDPSIQSVSPSAELPDSFIVRFFDGNAIAITHGAKISSIRHLSSGTKYAVNVAGVIYAIKKHRNGFYFVDEQFSYVNSDIEIACLTKMISLLDDGEQLFFTSHNAELLALPLPNHSFNFMGKTQDQEGSKIVWTNAASLEKRNNVNIKNLYDNDFFDVIPDVNRILNIAES